MNDHHQQHPGTPTAPATTSTPPGHQMDGRLMWVMMVGCCLAIPLALIVGGVTVGGLAGASPWLLGIAAALAVALIVTRRISEGPRCEAPPRADG